MNDQMESKDKQLAESALLIQDLSNRMNALTQRLHEQDNGKSGLIITIILLNARPSPKICQYFFH